MRTYIQLFIFCVALLFRPIAALATHVVGGEVKYDALGNDDYYIHLTLYVDCLFGAPGAILLDSTAFIGVFDGETDSMVNLETVYRGAPLRLNKSHYECVEPNGDVCVDMYTYDTVMHLPKNAFGYNIVYQRCCRNHSILNLVKPGDQGATYTAFIPGVERYGYNSNPRFNERPPNYLCLHEPFVFDHSATDPDGDSLVYSICNPFLGATPPRPKPRPLAPPHAPVRWQLPYTDVMPMAVKKDFIVDNQTGMLSFTPNRLGQYVFGVCVEEYRNGELLSRSLRDYQFNVIACEVVIETDISIPDFACREEVEISVSSTEATHYHWDFGLDSVDDDTSNILRPTFVYPGPGEYLVTLVVWRGQCADTVRQVVSILNRGARDSYNHTKCRHDSLVLTGRGFYGTQAKLRGDANFIPVNDSSVLIWSKTPGPFIIEYDTAGCIVYDSHYIDMPFIEPVISRDSLPHCLGSVFSFKVENEASFKKLTWLYGHLASRHGDEIKDVVPFNEIGEVTLATEEEGTHCKDSFHYVHSAPSKADFEINTFNIITPNRDKHNDCFSVEINGGDFECTDYHLWVYNRWGELVYEHDTPEVPPCWIGTNYKNGKDVAPGVYYFLLDIGGLKKQGTITVVR